MEIIKDKLSVITKATQEIASDIYPVLLDGLAKAIEISILNEQFIPKEIHAFLDAFIKFLQFNQKNRNKDGKKRIELIKLAMIAAIKFLSIWKFSNQIPDMLLPFVEPFFDVLFRIVNINNVLETKDTDNESKIEIAGLCARFKSTDIFIKKVLKEEHVDEPALQGLISHADIHIGIDEKGKLKCIIEQQMIGTRDDWKKCFENLHLLIRIYIMRNGLLLRLIACLKLKGYSRSTRCVLESLVEQEKEDAYLFLKFFSLPSKNNFGVISLFYPPEHKELATFLEDMGIPQRPKLAKWLDKNVFVINACATKITRTCTERESQASTEKNAKDKTISITRSFSCLHTIYGIRTKETYDSVYLQFKFTSVEGSHDLFYIQSPDKDEYLYMTENKGCMYAKQLPDPETAAQWKILQVYDEEGETMSFAFCAKQWPGKFLYLDYSRWETACRLIGFTDGQNDKEKQTSKCLFKVCPQASFPNMFSDNILVP